MKRIRNRTALLAAALALLPLVAHASSALDRAFGTPELGVSARLRGMGGAGGALGDGGLGVIDQPASPALTPTGPAGFAVQLSGGVARASENRLVPLYDTFDSYVHQTAIAVNDHGYGSFAAGLVLRHPSLAGVVLGLSSFEAWDPRYDYSDERRSTATTDQIVSERFIRTTGTLRETGLAAAREMGLGLSLGSALHVYTGHFTDRDALVPRQNGVSGRTVEVERQLRGVSLGLGAALRANERITGAVAWESGPRMRDLVTRIEDDSVVAGPEAERTAYWPARVHGAVVYRPRNSLRTTFAADVIWTAWSAVTDPAAPDRELLDTWDLRFGLEHHYLPDLPGRIGFRYERSPMMREADRAWFTLGAGWMADRYRLDGALEVGRRVSRQEPVWPRAEQSGAIGAGLDEVEDTALRVTFGVRVEI